MSPDPTSLERLHDIVTPTPVPWWPPAPGWLWLLGVVSVLAFVALVRGLVRWQQNRYRREALAELKGLESAMADASRQRRMLTELAALLKRTALTAYGREQVATLTGPAWFAFLDRTGGTRFGSGLGAALEQSIYHGTDAPWDTARARELIGEIQAWIRHHRAPQDRESDSTTGRAAAAPVAAARRNAA